MADLPILRLIKVLYLRGENCLQNVYFEKQKGSVFKCIRPVNWTGSAFPLLSIVSRCLCFL